MTPRGSFVLVGICTQGRGYRDREQVGRRFLSALFKRALYKADGFTRSW
jgi:hypothetical protein